MVALLLAAACGGGRGSPRAAYDSLRSALATDDGESVYALHDPESRQFYRAHVRDVRARLQRGDDPRQVLTQPDQLASVYLDGDEATAIGHMLAEYSEIATSWPWLLNSVVVEEVQEDADHARIRVRGTDGVESDLYFVRDKDGWAYDAYRKHMAR